MRRVSALVLILAASVLMGSGCSSGSSTSTTSSSSSAAAPRFGLAFIEAPAPDQIVRTDGDGSGRVVVPTTAHVGIDALDVSPSGDTIAYTARTEQEGAGQLWLMNLSGDKPTTVAPPTGQSFNCVRWSPDGTHLLLSVTDVAFTHTIGYLTIELATLAGTPLPVALPGNQLSCADWTRDGRHIVYAAANSAPPTVHIDELWEVGIDGTDLRKLGQLPAPCVINDPAVSPDDRVVAVDVICPAALVRDNGVWAIAVSDGTMAQLAGGIETTSSASSGDQYWNPRWLGDGTGLIYGRATTDATGAPHPLGIWRMDAGGQNQRQLTGAATILAAFALPT